MSGWVQVAVGGQALHLAHNLMTPSCAAHHHACVCPAALTPVIPAPPTLAPMQGLNKRCARELDVIGEQFPFQPLKFLPKSLRLEFAEGIQMLQEAGYDVSCASGSSCCRTALSLAWCCWRGLYGADGAPACSAPVSCLSTAHLCEFHAG